MEHAGSGLFVTYLARPLIDPFTGVRLFHIASHNLYDSSILTRNVEAGFTWFMKIQRAIYKSYASLASAI